MTLCTPARSTPTTKTISSLRRSAKPSTRQSALHIIPAWPSGRATTRLRNPTPIGSRRPSSRSASTARKYSTIFSRVPCTATARSFRICRPRRTSATAPTRANRATYTHGRSSAVTRKRSSSLSMSLRRSTASRRASPVNTALRRTDGKHRSPLPRRHRNALR